MLIDGTKYKLMLADLYMENQTLREAVKELQRENDALRVKAGAEGATADPGSIPGKRDNDAVPGQPD